MASAPIEPADEYAAAWESLRRRRRLRPFAFVLFVTAIGLLCTVHSDVRFAIAAPLLGLATIFTGYWTSFRCPRCGKLFGRRVYWKNHFTQKCLNCGIRIGTRKACDAGEDR